MDETIFWMKCSTDPIFFIKRVLGPNIHPKFSEQFDTFQEEMILVATNPKLPYITNVSFRGSLKTSIFSICLPLYFMCFHYDKIKIIGLTSSSIDTQSAEILSQLETIIQENEFLQFLIPQDRSSTWNSKEINTSKGTKYRVLPYNDSARSWSCDLLILDDILRAKDISQEEIKNIFWSVFYPIALKRNGKIWVVCTPQSATDLLVELNIDKGFYKTVYPAIVTDKNGNYVKPLWDKRYTLNHNGDKAIGCQCLMCVKARMGDMAWSKEMMCSPFSLDDKIFPYSIIEHNLHNVELTRGFSDRQYFMGMDVALSKSSTADYSAISILERGRNNMLVQRMVYRFKGWGQQQQINEIKRLHKQFNFTKILVEERGLSVGMVQDMKDSKLHPEISHVVEGFITTHENKEAIISKFATALQNNSIKLLNNPLLLNELNAFGCILKRDKNGNVKTTYEGVGEHDDIAMACFLSLEATNIIKGIGSISFIDW